MPYEKLYAAIRAACPETMELTFGCKIKYGVNYLYFGNIHIDWRFATILRRHKNWLYEIYETIDEVHGMKDLEITNFWRRDWEGPDKHYEIIGHPLQIMHVLRAIGVAMMNTNPSVIISIDVDGDFMRWMDGNHWEDTGVNFDLTKDLDGQSDETKEWLDKIICGV